MSTELRRDLPALETLEQLLSRSRAEQNERDFLIDLGDIQMAGDADVDAFAEKLSSEVALALSRGFRPLVLGGDHSITFPVLEGFIRSRRSNRTLSIVHLDAHCDLYEDLDHNPRSHGSPFARAFERKLFDGPLVQLGIRTSTESLRRQQERYGVKVLEAQDWPEHVSALADFLESALPQDTDVYVSLDLDVLDPAFCPGVSHHEPGGLSTRQVLQALQAIHRPIVGADVVELNPSRDVQGVSAMVAAKMVKELSARMLWGNFVNSR